jgi:hypothetical protein
MNDQHDQLLPCIPQSSADQALYSATLRHPMRLSEAAGSLATSA